MQGEHFILLFIIVLNAIYAMKDTLYLTKDKFIQLDHIQKIKRSDASVVHQVSIAVKQRNLDVIDTMLAERSDPNHQLYQHWLTFDEIGTLVRNDEAVDAITDWLQSNGVTVMYMTPHGDYIKASTTIQHWERLLRATFYLFQDNHPDIKSPVRYNRAESYSIPRYLDDHIHGIFMTSQAPVIAIRRYGHLVPVPNHVAEELDHKRRGSKRNPDNASTEHVHIADSVRESHMSLDAITDIRPSSLNTIYNIPSNMGT
jgi:subtilase family serine protease